MKKLFSIVISLLMVVNLFTGITTTATTEQEQTIDYVTNIDFDVEKSEGYKYFGAEEDQSTYPAFIDLDDGEHGNVYATYMSRPVTETQHRGYMLRNSNSSTNEPLKLEYGKSYRISLDYKLVQSKNHWKNISIWWVKDATANTSYSDVRYDYNERCTVMETVSNDTSSDIWEEATAVITPPDSEYVYPVLVVYNYRSLINVSAGEKIYFDNIAVWEYEYKTSTSVDFTYELENSYKYLNKETRDGLPESIYKLDDTHNEVFGVYVMGNEASHRSYVIREENTNYPLPLKAGQDYKISLNYLNQKSNVDFKISIAWVENPSISIRSGLPGTYGAYDHTYDMHLKGVESSYNPVNECPYIQDLVTVAANSDGADTEWQSLTATITPYSNEKMYPILFVHPVNSSGTYTNERIYFDDINISLGKTDVVTSIDFEDELSGKYSYYRGADSDQETYPVFTQKDGDAAYTVYTTADYGNTTAQRGYLIRDSKTETYEPLKLEYGKHYRIDLNYKVDKINNRWHVISIFWLKSAEDLTVNPFSPANNYCSVFETYNGVISDWRNATGVITPPNEEYVYPVLVTYNYGMTNAHNSEIYFDDIVVTDYEFKDSTYIDFDYEAGENYNYYFNDTHSNRLADSFSNLYDDASGVYDGTNKVVVSDADVHGNVFNVSVVRDSEGDVRTYSIREPYSNAPMPLEYGETYDIELSYKIYKASNSYNISIVWVDNPAITKVSGLPLKYYAPGTTVLKENMPGISNTYMPLYSNPYIEDIAINMVRDIDGDGWVTVNGTITPPDEKKIYPVLLVRPKDNIGTHTGQRISIDNISVSKQTKETVKPARVDFSSGRQSEFYTAVSNVTSNPLFLNGAEISDSVAEFSGVNSMDTAVTDMNVLAVSDTEGNNFARYKAGTKLLVTANVNTADCSGEKLSLGIAYADTVIQDGCYTEGDLNALKEAGKLLKVAELDAGVSDYREVRGVITVPEHLNYESMYLVVYSESATTGAVKVKDITVSNADMNFSGQVDIVDLVRLKKSTTLSYDCNCDVNADEAVNATDLVCFKKLLLVMN